MSKTYVLGVDPGKRKITAGLIDGPRGRALMEPRDFAANREGFEELLGVLRKNLKAEDRLIVGVEASAAYDDNLLAWFASLRNESWAMRLIRLDAAQVARFSGARPVRGKTDKSDVRWRIALFTLTFAEELDSFEHDERALAMLRLVNERAHLVVDRAGWINRLKDRLVISFPEFETVLSDLESPLALAVLSQVPTAAHGSHHRAKTLARIKPAAPRSHRLGPDRAQALLQAAKRSVASATQESDAQAVRFAVSELESLGGRIAQIEHHMETYYHEVSDVASPAAQACARGAAQEGAQGQEQRVLDSAQSGGPDIPEQLRLVDSVPGVGMVGACVVVLRSRGLGRFTSAKALAAQLGTCPDRDQTGSSRDRAHLTHRGDRCARATLYMMTQSATLCDPVMAFHKWLHLRSGLKPKQAVCACMNRMARWIFGVVKNRTAYNPAQAIENASRHHAELWAEFLKTEWKKTA